MEEIKNKIYAYLKEGMYKKDAAAMAGISEATFYRWLEEDESFESQVKANILEYKRSLVQILNTAAIKDGRLALEVLKRRFPRDWDGTYDERVEDGKGDTAKVAEYLRKLYEQEEDKLETYSTEDTQGLFS